MLFHLVEASATQPKQLDYQSLSLQCSFIETTVIVRGEAVERGRQALFSPVVQ